MNKINLLKYAIGYLSKYNSSKKNLERVLKSKIMRITTDKKQRFEYYNEINLILNKLETKHLIDDNIYVESKINSFVSQGKSKIFIQNYLLTKGIDKKIIINNFIEYEKNNENWEKKSAFIFAKKKKLLNTNEEFEKKLGKMARAGFSYEICKEILN